MIKLNKIGNLKSINNNSNNSNNSNLLGTIYWDYINDDNETFIGNIDNLIEGLLTINNIEDFKNKYKIDIILIINKDNLICVDSSPESYIDLGYAIYYGDNEYMEDLINPLAEMFNINININVNTLFSTLAVYTDKHQMDWISKYNILHINQTESTVDVYLVVYILINDNKINIIAFK